MKILSQTLFSIALAVACSGAHAQRLYTDTATRTIVGGVWSSIAPPLIQEVGVSFSRASATGIHDQFGLGGADAEAWAIAEFGSLYVSTSVDAVNHSYSYAAANARFEDSVQISSADFANGTPAVVRWSAVLTAPQLPANGNHSRLYAQFAFESVGGYLMKFWGSDSNDVYRYGAHLGFGMNTFETTVTLGNSNHLTMDVLCESSTHSGEGGYGESSMRCGGPGFAFYWGGIETVTVDGRSINYSVSSGSGTDYSQSSVTAVPEPETYVLMGLGLGLLGWAKRCRKQQAV